MAQARNVGDERREQIERGVARGQAAAETECSITGERDRARNQRAVFGERDAQLDRLASAEALGVALEERRGAFLASTQGRGASSIGILFMEEFDIEAALARRPGLILMDELAHTNAEGSRHPKRWQDVDELLGAGVDVFSTLNVQHVESLNDVIAKVQPLIDAAIDGASSLPALGQLPNSIAEARARVADLKNAANANVGGVSLPSGLRQSILSFAQGLDGFLADLQAFPTLVTQGKALFDALDAIVGQPDQIGNLFSDPGTLQTRVQAVADAIGPLKTTVGGIKLLDGAPHAVVPVVVRGQRERPGAQPLVVVP